MVTTIKSTTSVRPVANCVRLYTVVPSTPQQPTTDNNGVKPNDNFNSVHALYNNENQSVHESQYIPGQTYRSLSSDENTTFSPEFNSVFDE